MNRIKGQRDVGREEEEGWFLKGVREGLSVRIRREQRPEDEESLMRRHTSWGRAHCGEKQAEASGELAWQRLVIFRLLIQIRLAFLH